MMDIEPFDIVKAKKGIAVFNCSLVHPEMRGYYLSSIPLGINSQLHLFVVMLVNDYTQEHVICVNDEGYQVTITDFGQIIKNGIELCHMAEVKEQFVNIYLHSDKIHRTGKLLYDTWEEANKVGLERPEMYICTSPINITTFEMFKK